MVLFTKHGKSVHARNNVLASVERTCERKNGKSVCKNNANLDQINIRIIRFAYFYVFHEFVR